MRLPTKGKRCIFWKHTRREHHLHLGETSGIQHDGKIPAAVWELVMHPSFSMAKILSQRLKNPIWSLWSKVSQGILWLPAAASDPAWKINHILWKFLTFPDRLRGTSMFRIAMLFLNKQEERPFISN